MSCVDYREPQNAIEPHPGTPATPGVPAQPGIKPSVVTAHLEMSASTPGFTQSIEGIEIPGLFVVQFLTIGVTYSEKFSSSALNRVIINNGGAPNYFLAPTSDLSGKIPPVPKTGETQHTFSAFNMNLYLPLGSYGEVGKINFALEFKGDVQVGLDVAFSGLMITKP